jgi:hypothetical protein
MRTAPISTLAALALLTIAPPAASAAEGGGGWKSVPAGYVEITPEAERAIARGLKYLAGTQQEDGAWGNDQWPKHTGISGFCLMALLSSGSTPGEGPYGAECQKAVDFLLEQIKPSGFCATKWTSYGPMYGHAVATLALSECYGMAPREDMREKLRKAVDVIVRSQHPDGGWRYLPVPTGDSDISVTVCQVMALRSARNAGFTVPKGTIDRAVEYVRRCARPDGSFSYQVGGTPTFACTAAGLTTLFGAGVYHDKQLELSTAYLSRNAPDVDGQTRWAESGHYFYGHYYAIQAMYQAGGKHWENWYPKIRNALVKNQDRDGGWDEGVYVAKKTGNIGRVYATASALTILQAPKRYLPIFQR